jgi:hypothetical protein
VYPTARAYGGAGGQVATGIGVAGRGGDAVSVASGTSADMFSPVYASSLAVGGPGGIQIQTGIGGDGGDATAISKPGVGQASATAVGGMAATAAIHGAALARAQIGTNAYDSALHLSAESRSGVLTTIVATVDGSAAAGGAAEARALVARPRISPLLGTNLVCFSFATGKPIVADSLSAIVGNPNINADFDIGGLSDVLGLLVLGGRSGTLIVTAAVQPSQLASIQNLRVGLFNPVATGAGFSSLSFQISKSGTPLVNTNFTSLPSAMSYFSDHVLDFGVLTNGVSGVLNLQFTLGITGNDAFRTELIFANAGGHDSVGDGIPDSWRAKYFGGSGAMTNTQSCATCDADGTGQNNLFKYVAGLDPTNAVSVFNLKISSVTGQQGQQNLLFNPVATGRTYLPEFRTNLTFGGWSSLTSYTGPTTNGNQVTITDTNAVEPQKFYRVHISLP